MADYLSAPDKQSYALQPYQMPYNQIMQTVQAKTQYWLQGANQLKSAAQNAAGLDLSLDENRNALKDFTGKANEQINQAAKSDLSIGDNVNQALHIFDPLYDGQSDLSQNIMGDHAITTRAKQIQQQFEESKTKNNGKEYSPINEQYALQSYYDFIKNGDPKGWKDAYQSLKGYSPYHDYHKEITDNLRNCKPSSVTQTGVNGMYITSESSSGLTSSQVAGCVGSNLSPQAEEQMRIEGVVKYGHNYQALADSYLPIANNNRQYLAVQRAQIAAQMADPKITPQMKQGLQNQLQSFDSQISNIDESIDRYHKGDLSFFKNNYDTLSAAAYRGEKLQAIGNAFAYTEKKNDLKADPVQMMISNHQFQDKELSRRLDMESQMALHKDGMEYAKMDLEAMKAGMKMMRRSDGSIYFVDATTGNPTTYFPSVNGDAVSRNGQAEFNTQLTTNQQETAANKDWLYNYLKSNPKWADLVPNKQKDPAAFNAFEQGIFNHMDRNNIDVPLQQYLQKKQQLELEHANLIAVQNAVESSSVAKSAKNPIGQVLANIHGGQVVPVHDNAGRSSQIPLSEDQIKSLLTGDGKYGMTMHKDMQVGEYGTSDRWAIKLPGGKEVYVSGGPLQDILNKNDNVVKNYQNTLNDLYSQNNVSQRAWVSLGHENDDNKSPNTLRERIAYSLGPLIGHGENSSSAVKDIALEGTDFNGRVRFTIKPDAKGNLPDDKAVIQNLAANGFPNIVKVPNATGIYEVSGIGNVGNINYNRPEVGQIGQVQSLAERLVQIHRQGGDRSSRVVMPDYNGIHLAAVTGPSGEMYFEISDGQPNHQPQHVGSASDLVYTLNRLSQ